MPTQSRQQLKFQALLAERARFMRFNGTDTERALWRCLSGKQLGVAFRRQVVVARYVVDFLAPAVKLVVEVDGGYHRQRVAADARRTRVLERLGYRVLRLFWCPRGLSRVRGRGCSRCSAPAGPAKSVLAPPYGLRYAQMGDPAPRSVVARLACCQLLRCCLLLPTRKAWRSIVSRVVSHSHLGPSCRLECLGS